MVYLREFSNLGSNTIGSKVLKSFYANEDSPMNSNDIQCIEKI